MYKLSGLDYLLQMVSSFGLAYRPAQRDTQTDRDSKKVRLWTAISCREYCPPPRPIQVQSLIHPVTVFCLSQDKAKTIM